MPGTLHTANSILHGAVDIFHSAGYIVVRAPRQISKLPVWSLSLTGFKPTAERTPMMPYNAIEWLRNNVQSTWSVFEYGSGGSTFFFANRAAHIVSIEHEKGWYDIVDRSLHEQGYTNTEYHYVAPQSISESAPPQCCALRSLSDKPQYADRHFGNYMRAIEPYPDQSFDLVVVDGRARACCVRAAIPKVKPGGYLLIDDTRRKRYHDAIAAVPGDRLIFTGLGPHARELGETTIVRIKNGNGA